MASGSGVTGVAHLAQVDRALRGPGPMKAERRRHFPHDAPTLSRVASETDSRDFARALREWTDAVDHAPSGRELDAISSRFLSFSEYGDTCLVEGSLPLIEGRLLRRRLEALVDAHFRNPGVARLDDRWRADRPPSSTGGGADDQVADAVAADHRRCGHRQRHHRRRGRPSHSGARSTKASLPQEVTPPPADRH